MGKDSQTDTRGNRTGTATRRFGKPELRRVGKVLHDQRIALGLSLRALSESSGLSIAAIRALEAGASNPGLGTVVPVVDALGLKLNRVIDAARATQDRVAITRAGSGEGKLSRGLADAVLSAHLIRLGVGSLRPTLAEATHRPSLGVVVSGSVIVSVDTDPTDESSLSPGKRIRLDCGDNFLAKPGLVKSLANAADADARVLLVVDKRSNTAGGEP